VCSENSEQLAILEDETGFQKRLKHTRQDVRSDCVRVNLVHEESDLISQRVELTIHQHRLSALDVVNDAFSSDGSLTRRPARCLPTNQRRPA
jgi:hypothetical protein